MTTRTLDRPAGFTLPEVLVVMGLSALIMAGTSVLAIHSSRVSRSEGDRLLTHQSGRVVASLMVDDLRGAGHGLNLFSSSAVDSVLLTSTPPVRRVDPNADQATDAVTIRTVDDTAWTYLATDVSAVDDDWIYVDDTTPFSVGDKLVIYDQSGDYDIRELYQIDTGPSPPALRVRDAGNPPPDLMKLYLVVDPAASMTVVASLLEVIYQHDTASLTVTRAVNGAAAQVIAEQVESLTLTYFDGAGADDTIVPADEVERRTIVRARLEVTSRSRRKQHGPSRDYQRDHYVTSTALRNRVLGAS